jgi:hypothetical protein
MFLNDPFKIGPAVPLTEKQKADAAFEKEWQDVGKPSLEEVSRTGTGLSPRQ